MEVLDKNGLQYFWGKAKEYVDNNTGASNYTDLSNKPQINNVELVGNKSLSDIGVQQTVISETEPMDDSVEVWIDPSGDVTTIPTKTSDLVNDSGFITEETDPTVPSHVKGITQDNITSWNNKSNFSGSYNDLTDKPSIPNATSDLTNDSGFITNAVNNLTNYTPTSSLSTVATSGSYNDLTNKPTIPTKTSDLTNDSNFITSAIFSYDSETETLTITTEA